MSEKITTVEELDTILRRARESFYSECRPMPVGEECCHGWDSAVDEVKVKYILAAVLNHPPAQVTTIEELFALPVGSVLRHRMGSLVEIVTKPLCTGPMLTIGGHIQNQESLTSWDFPMDLLYRPEVTL